MAERSLAGYIVDPSHVVSCAWCGTVQSTDWVSTQNGTYCSQECLKASRADANYAMAACYACLSLLLFWFGHIQGVLYSVVMIPAGIYAFIQAREGKKYADRKDRFLLGPVDPERVIPESDGSIPYGLVAVCAYCNHVNKAGLLRCRNCGASLATGIVAYQPVGGRYRGIKCPRCAAIYTYGALLMRVGAQTTCQNCARPFVITPEMLAGR